MTSAPQAAARLPSRRQILLWGAGALWLSACGKTETAQAVQAAEIDPQSTCSLDGMLLADYPGPKGQIHYVGDKAPIFFCDTVELIQTLLQPEQPKALRAAFVQDMGKADWDKPVGHWIDAKAAFYVRGSKRHGSMGPTLASFAQEADAAGFVQTWGGRVLRFAEIKPDMVDLSGGAEHDGRM